MVIRENVDLYRYEIHSLVKAFYPEENVKVVVEGDPHADRIMREDPDVFLDVEMEKDSITLRIHGKDHEEVCRRMDADPVRGCSGDFSVKSRYTKDSLKTFLYDVLSDYTGRSLPWGDLIGIRPTKIAMTQIENGVSPEEAEAFMQREHQVSSDKAKLAVEIAEREKKILSNIHYENGYSLYIGIPFCPTTCLYCSFPSFNIALWQDRIDDYLSALEREMEAAAKIMKGKVLDTIYIGGGTPTSLSAAQLDRLLCAIERHWNIRDNAGVDRAAGFCGHEEDRRQDGKSMWDGISIQDGKSMHTIQEFTIEAGRADSITREKLEIMRKHPVTRISVNPQTMKEDTLKIIGRHHTVQQVIDTFHEARDCGFDNINMDIILGLPGEDAQDVLHTVQEIEKLSPDSLTVHSLAIKRASRLRRIIDEKGYPVLINTDETMAIAADAAARMGMEPYYLYRQKNMSGNFENVGYAREGKYGIYNILIMEEKQTIMALGAGAITKRVFHQVDGNTRIERCDNPKDIQTYLDNTDEMLERKYELFGLTN